MKRASCEEDVIGPGLRRCGYRAPATMSHLSSGADAFARQQPLQCTRDPIKRVATVNRSSLLLAAHRTRTHRGPVRLKLYSTHGQPVESIQSSKVLWSHTCVVLCYS